MFRHSAVHCINQCLDCHLMKLNHLTMTTFCFDKYLFISELVCDWFNRQSIETLGVVFFIITHMHKACIDRVMKEGVMGIFLELHSALNCQWQCIQVGLLISSIGILTNKSNTCGRVVHGVIFRIQHRPIYKFRMNSRYTRGVLHMQVKVCCGCIPLTLPAELYHF